VAVDGAADLDSGQTTYVQPPSPGLFSSVALNCSSIEPPLAFPLTGWELLRHWRRDPVVVPSTNNRAADRSQLERPAGVEIPLHGRSHVGSDVVEETANARIGSRAFRIRDGERLPVAAQEP
jgi:hypothetical protein